MHMELRDERLVELFQLFVKHKVDLVFGAPETVARISQTLYPDGV